MITHGNMVATIAAVRTIIPNLGTSDVYLAYLPLAHVFELAAEVIFWHSETSFIRITMNISSDMVLLCCAVCHVSFWCCYWIRLSFDND